MDATMAVTMVATTTTGTGLSANGFYIGMRKPENISKIEKTVVIFQKKRKKCA